MVTGVNAVKVSSTSELVSKFRNISGKTVSKRRCLVLVDVSERLIWAQKLQIENKISITTGLVTIDALNAEVTEIETKIPDITNLAKS